MQVETSKDTISYAFPRRTDAPDKVAIVQIVIVSGTGVAVVAAIEKPTIVRIVDARRPKLYLYTPSTGLHIGMLT